MRFSFALFPVLLCAPAFAEPPRVVVDIAPVHALVSQVMDGISTPDLLLEQDANPHSVQLKPSQARMLAGADLLIWVGPELSPWLDRIAAAQKGDQLALMAHPATLLREFAQPREAGGAHGGGENALAQADGDDGEQATHTTGSAGGAPADEGHTEEAHGGHADHAHTGHDPHVWLTTTNARAWLNVFAETFAARDPENADRYRSNAAAAEARLDALDVRIEGRLAAHQGAEIVTFHDSFGYFADRFGLRIAGSVRPGDAAAPSAAAMSRLQGLVADHGVKCAFAEPAFDPGLLEAIAADTGLRIGTLDPTGALQPIGPGNYAATLDAIAQEIASCLEQE